MAIGIMEVQGFFGAILLIFGIYILMTKKKNKKQLFLGIGVTVIGGILLLLSIVRWAMIFMKFR